MDRELCRAPSDSCSSPPFPFQCLSIFRGTSTPLALLRLQIPILILRWGPCLGLDGKVSRMWILHNQNTSFEDWKFRCWAPAGFHWPLQNGRIRAAAKRGEKEIQIRRWCWSVLYSQSECLQSWPRSWGGAMAMAGDDQRSSPNLLQSPLGTDWWPYHAIPCHTILYHTAGVREVGEGSFEQGVVPVKLQLADESPVLQNPNPNQNPNSWYQNFSWYINASITKSKSLSRGWCQWKYWKTNLLCTASWGIYHRISHHIWIQIQNP